MSSTKKDKTLTEIALAFYRKQNEEMNNFIDDEALKEIVEEQIKPIIREWLEQRREQVKTKSLYQDALFNTDYILLSKLIEELS